jgi:hypothetical protein
MAPMIAADILRRLLPAHPVCGSRSVRIHFGPATLIYNPTERFKKGGHGEKAGRTHAASA